MQRKPVESKSLRSVGYDPETLELEVEFRNGRLYVWSGVPASVHAWLLRSPGKGGLFNRMIRDRYPFRELSQAQEPADLSEALRKSLEPPREQ